MFLRPSLLLKLLCGCGPMALHPARSKMEPYLACAFFLDLLLRVQSRLNSKGGKKNGMLNVDLHEASLQGPLCAMLRPSLFWHHCQSLRPLRKKCSDPQCNLLYCSMILLSVVL